MFWWRDPIAIAEWASTREKVFQQNTGAKILRQQEETVSCCLINGTCLQVSVSEKDTALHVSVCEKVLVTNRLCRYELIFNFKNPKGHVSKWIKRLQEYHFDIQHNPKNHHHNADTLSRTPCPDLCMHCRNIKAKNWNDNWNWERCQRNSEAILISDCWYNGKNPK